MDFIRGSSSFTRIEMHVSYKVRYCHKVFDFVEVKQRCQEIFFEVAALHQIIIDVIGFESDHVHMDIQIRNTHRQCDVDKWFKGTSGRKLLKEFSEIKKKYFWGSGFWGDQGYADSVGRDPEIIKNYVRNQGKQRKELSLKNFFRSPDGVNTIGL